jgi:sulfatase maturation enzyme AslB (radical SAM superfamily)
MSYLKYPKIIAFELSSLCQMKCIHCPHGHGMINKKGLMDWQLFEAVMEDIETWRNLADTDPKIVLYGNGEPFLHPRLIDFVQYCTDHGFYKSLSTNVQLVSNEKAGALSRAGLDFIKLSFWGDNREEYESRVKRFTFGEAIQKAKDFAQHAQDNMEISINVVKYRSRGQALVLADDFLAHFEGLPNLKFYSFYGSDWRGTLDIPEFKVPLCGEIQKAPCKLAGELLPVSWEGKIPFCWLDYNRVFALGDYYSGSLLKYWQGKERRKILNMMSKGKFSDIELCRACSAPYTERTKERFFDDQNSKKIIVGKHIYDDDFLEN